MGESAVKSVSVQGRCRRGRGLPANSLAGHGALLAGPQVVRGDPLVEFNQPPSGRQNQYTAGPGALRECFSGTTCGPMAAPGVQLTRGDHNVRVRDHPLASTTRRSARVRRFLEVEGAEPARRNRVFGDPKIGLDRLRRRERTSTTCRRVWASLVDHGAVNLMRTDSTRGGRVRLCPWPKGAVA
jgi:hypothetical protein